MRGGLDRRFLQDSRNSCMGALACRAPGTIGYGHKTGAERRKPLDRIPQRNFHFFRRGRKKLEGNGNLGMGGARPRKGAKKGFVHATTRAVIGRGSEIIRRSRPSHKDTVSFPVSPDFGARLSAAISSSPAAVR